jgi:hypothetical protein
VQDHTPQCSLALCLICHCRGTRDQTFTGDEVCCFLAAGESSEIKAALYFSGLWGAWVSHKTVMVREEAFHRQFVAHSPRNAPCSTPSSDPNVTERP